MGTEKYMAPEMVEGKQYSGKATDMYACGVILFSMVCGFMPVYQKASNDDYLYKYIYNENFDQYWK